MSINFKELKQSQAHNSAIYKCKLNKDHEYLMTGSQDRSIKLWNVESLRLVKTFSGPHNFEVLDLVIMNDNSKFVSCGGDKTLFIWDVLNSKVVKSYEAHSAMINTVALNTDESVLLSGSYDASVKFWDIRVNSSKPIQILRDYKDSVSKVIVDNYIVYSGCVDGKIRQHDLRMGVVSVDDIGGGIVDISISNDRKVIIANTLDNQSKLYHIGSGDVIQKYDEHQSNQHKCECIFSYDDQYVICGSQDGQIYVYDVLRKQRADKVEMGKQTVTSLQLSKDRLIAVNHNGLLAMFSY